MNNSSTLDATADASGTPRTPLANTFSRPAALVGGAIGLVLLTAAATTLMVRSPASKEVADSHSATAATLMSETKSVKSGGSVVPQAPADYPDQMEPKVEAKPASSESASPKPAPVAARKATAPATTAKAGAGTPGAVASACTNCGVVEAVTPFKKKGEGTGVGAVGGAVVGGLLGNAMGGGDGRKAMTVLGAVGGGVAGNAIEKNARATTQYQVTVRMQDGTVRTITQATAPTVGQKVTVEGSQIKNRV
ncbi:MAG: glycine zipper 2TM domain-containing protein, partial [Aquincola sp.]|nr:glycine zipper 2TM domain-containing protein [Aquincola sp.]